MAKLSATLEGVLEQFQLCFIDLEKQEKRALSLLKKRDEEMNAKLAEEAEDGKEIFRSLKEIDTIDRLQHDALKLINDNNKLKIELSKFYATTILNNKSEEIPVSAYETDTSKTPLSALDFDALRKAVDNGEITFKK